LVIESRGHPCSSDLNKAIVGGAGGASACAGPFLGVHRTCEGKERLMLELLLARAPLDGHWRSTIVREYCRLTGAAVSEEDFRRWTEQSPAGAALHALLKTGDGRIVGHCCLFPFPLYIDGRRLVGAKSEYLFLHEEFRRAEIDNLPTPECLPALSLLKRLYRHGSEALGWDPILISAPPEVAVLHRLAGALPVELNLFECLLVLRPWSASRRTPNLSFAERMAIFLVGSVQCLMWRALCRLCCGRVRSVRPLGDPGGIRPRTDQSGMTCPLDEEFLSWRYPKAGFELYELGSEAGSFLAATNSSGDYLRVVDSNLDFDRVGTLRLVAGLVGQARRRRSVGVRWALYDGQNRGERFARKLRSLGLICARRKRRISIYAKNRDLARAERWQLGDVIVSFDRR
jgi:hypothetical protein